MLEILLALLFVGVIISSSPRLVFGNPFQIYFSVWFAALLGLYIYRDDFIDLDGSFILSLIATNCLALLIMLYAYFSKKTQPKTNVVETISVNNAWLLNIFQFFTVLLLPVAFAKASALAGDAGVFSVLGYRSLRTAMNYDGQSLGFVNYVFVLSYVIASIRFVNFKLHRACGAATALSIIVSFFYAFLTTGRTSVLLLLVLLFFPFIGLRLLNVRALMFLFALFISIFIGMAAMLSKGLNVGSSIESNLVSLGESLSSYSVAPIVALSQLTESISSFGWGENSFRFFHAIFYALGLSSSPPVQLVKPFVFVPYPTNVYTVYGIYFRDFSYLGLFFPSLFLIFHWQIYKRCLQNGGIWIFFYAVSSYPLLMQFFQDQYFSLLSTWIQIVVWFSIFLWVPRLRFRRKDVMP